MLQWNAVEFSYPKSAPLLAGWRWQAEPGMVQLVDGESAGKTTALQLLAGALAPRAGAVLVDGNTPAQLQQAHDVFWHEPRLPATMPADTTTPAQWAQALAAHHVRWDAAVLADVQQGLDIAQHWHKPLLALSTGSLRKAVMALALASGAKLVLLDEPLSGLDKPAIAFVEQALQAAAQRFADEGRYLVVAHYEALLPAQGKVQLVPLPLAP